MSEKNEEVLPAYDRGASADLVKLMFDSRVVKTIRVHSSYGNLYAEVPPRVREDLRTPGEETL